MRDFLTALALVLVLEGLFLALMPRRLRQILEVLEQIAPETLRMFGLVVACIGVLAIWLIRG
jgi:uncharacterized protein YjeT (DUF2065 family)